MDPKNLQSRLSEWSRQLGFKLPDGTFPESTFFSQLISTPNTVHLWENILSKVEPRYKIKNIRKQILVAKLKSNEKQESQQDPMLNVSNAGIHRKVDMWKKKKTLEKMIVEKKKEVDQCRDNIYKQAQLFQLESCKLAEIEKQHYDLKEKLLISNLLIERHKRDIEKYKKQISKIKSYQRGSSLDSVNGYDAVFENGKEKFEKIAENLEKNSFKMEEESKNEFAQLITDKNSISKLWNLLLEVKMKNLKEYSATVDEFHTEDERDRDDELGEGRISARLLKEKFMLDITENSLQTISNRKFEKLENLKLKEVTSNIEQLMFNKSIASSSQVEISYIQPNETGDSLTGRKEKMAKFMKALSVYGLKKRNEFLKREIEKLVKENKKNEHWSAEKEKFENEALRSSEKFESVKEETSELMNVQKSSVQQVLKGHMELVLALKDINNDLNERKVLEMLNGFLMDIKKGSECEIELVADMCLDVFRKIQISPGKEVYEWESLEHCLDHYGGELRELFATLLISPNEKPETIISTLEERKSFLSRVKDLITKFDDDFKNYEARFAEGSGPPINRATIEKNYKETFRRLEKVAASQEKLKTELDLVRNILKSWLKQPYRLMIPDSVTVNSMTLRQFEEKYRRVQSEIKYCTDLDQSVANK